MMHFDDQQMAQSVKTCPDLPNILHLKSALVVLVTFDPVTNHESADVPFT